MSGSPPLLSRAGRTAQVVSLCLSGLLCVFLIACYALRPDRYAAITIYPVWAWLVPGLFLAWIGGWHGYKRVALGLLLLWLLYLLAFAEEPTSLLRRRAAPTPEWEAARRRGEAVRVVSLNCKVHRKEVAAEVVRYRPDIVLLQESPSEPEVREVAQQLFGSEAAVVWGKDTSLIVRGRAVPPTQPHKYPNSFAQARVRLTSGLEAEVISVHLLSPHFRLDLWNPECWQRRTADRRRQRDQVRTIMAQVAAIAPAVPVIVGGDFNAPAGDAIFRLLPPRLHDTFRESGSGWSATYHNSLPALRIDQVWVSDAFRAASVYAQKTLHSDHRMVICDLWLREKGQVFP